MRLTATLDHILARWHLIPDGERITTHSSILLPVCRDGRLAMLKVPQHPEERVSIGVLPWWEGNGTVRVLSYDDEAILMERLAEEPSLAAMARQGDDDEATRIICSVVARLHAPRNHPPPAAAIPLRRWFQELAPVAAQQGGILRRANEIAEALLREPRDVVVLHGDIHHGNILHGGERGWLAIDPKGLIGERVFDYVNLLRNPDREIALMPGRLARQASVVAEAAGLERTRLLQWTLAIAGLSAAWILNDGDEPDLDLAVAELATGELAK
jgi:streptomycin 6-kinase